MHDDRGESVLVESSHVAWVSKSNFYFYRFSPNAFSYFVMESFWFSPWGCYFFSFIVISMLELWSFRIHFFSKFEVFFVHFRTTGFPAFSVMYIPSWNVRVSLVPLNVSFSMS